MTPAQGQRDPESIRYGFQTWTGRPGRAGPASTGAAGASLRRWLHCANGQDCAAMSGTYDHRADHPGRDSLDHLVVLMMDPHAQALILSVAIIVFALAARP